MLDYSMVLSQMLHVTISHKAFFDTGAAANIIKIDVFRKLSSSSQDLITTLPPDVNLNCISGKIILPHGKVLLSLSLSSQNPDICNYFYIVSDVSFNIDLLVGFNTMWKY